MNDLRNIRAVIFDLDGTLYQDHSIHCKYMELLTAGTPWENKVQHILEEVNEMMKGNRMFKLGHVYRHDNQTAVFETVRQLMQFEGIQIGLAGEFPGQWLNDSDLMVAGDAWSLCAIVARRIGITLERGNRAFAETREGMHEAGTTVEHHDELVPALKRLNKRLVRLMIASNTPIAMASELAAYLNVHQLAHDYNYGARKPFGLIEMLPEWLRMHGLEPGQLLAVGDNGFNDLYPIKHLGGKTVLITPHRVDDRMNWDYRLHNLNELVELVERIAESGE